MTRRPSPAQREALEGLARGDRYATPNHRIYTGVPVYEVGKGRADYFLRATWDALVRNGWVEFWTDVEIPATKYRPAYTESRYRISDAGRALVAPHVGPIGLVGEAR